MEFFTEFNILLNVPHSSCQLYKDEGACLISPPLGFAEKGKGLDEKGNGECSSITSTSLPGHHSPFSYVTIVMIASNTVTPLLFLQNFAVSISLISFLASKIINFFEFIRFDGTIVL